MTTILFLSMVNLWTLLCFWRDKARARQSGRRVPERDLLMLALIGGSPAAFAARAMLRHKTVKEPFSTWLKLIAVTQAAGLMSWWLL